MQNLAIERRGRKPRSRAALELPDTDPRFIGCIRTLADVVATAGAHTRNSNASERLLDAAARCFEAHAELEREAAND